MKKTLLVVILINAFLSLDIAANSLKANATLHLDKPGPILSRYLQGQFSEHLGAGVYDGIWVGPDSGIPNTRGIRKDVVKALKSLSIPIVRWPGGCFADEYYWRDGLGPYDERPVRKNNWWGGTEETNAFGTHEYMDFMQQIDADPYVSVNLGSSTPTDMREWIEYITSDGKDSIAQERRRNGRDKPWPVALWGIGNESWGCGGNMRAEYYADEYNRFAAFFHKSDTNNGLRIASGSNADDYHWTEVMMKQSAKYMDGISLHYYTLPTGDWDKKGNAIGFNKEEWVSTFANTLKMDEFIMGHSEVMDKYDPEKRIGLYIDEWGTWYDPAPGNQHSLYQQNTLRDALVAAVNLNIFHHHAKRVRMTAIAQTINVLQAMILTKGSKIALTPTYYAFKMFVPFQDARFLPIKVDAPKYNYKNTTIPSLSASAALAQDGDIYIALVNMNPDDEINLQLRSGIKNVKSIKGEILTAEALDAHNVPGESEAVYITEFKGISKDGKNISLDIPEKSIVVLRIEK